MPCLCRPESRLGGRGCPQERLSATGSDAGRCREHQNWGVDWKLDGWAGLGNLLAFPCRVCGRRRGSCGQRNSLGFPGRPAWRRNSARQVFDPFLRSERQPAHSRFRRSNLLLRSRAFPGLCRCAEQPAMGIPLHLRKCPARPSADLSYKPGGPHWGRAARG